MTSRDGNESQAEVLDLLAASRASAGDIQRRCDQWMAAEGVEAVRTHLRDAVLDRPDSLAAAVEWLFKQRNRLTPEADFPLAEKLLAAEGLSSSSRASFLATAVRDVRTVELVYSRLVSEPTDWAEMLDLFVERKAKTGIVHRHCDKWMGAQSVGAIRGHLSAMPPERLSSFGSAVEWLFRQSRRVAPEADVPLAEKLLAAEGLSSSSRASFLAAAVRDKRTAELAYRTLVSRPSDWPQMLDRFAEWHAKAGIIHRHCEKWAAAQGIEAIRSHLSDVPGERLGAFAPAVEWLFRQSHRAAREADLPLAERLLAAMGINPPDEEERRHLADTGALLDILVAREDLSSEQSARTALLLIGCQRRREAFVFAKRARVDGIEANPKLSKILLRQLEYDPEFLTALEINDAETIAAKLAIYAPDQAETLATTRIESVGEICSRMRWPYEEVIPSSEIDVCHPRYFGEGEEVATEKVIHPPIYRAELHDVVAHGGSLFIASGSTGVYETMQAPGSDRMMHRDAISLVGAGGNLLHRRVQPERHVAVGIWMLCHEAHYYYHWLYDVCSRSLAYGHFGAFPAGSSILVDEAALAIPQLVEILQLLNPCGLDVQSIASGEAVRVERLFVAAPAVWNGFNFRKNAPVQATDNVFHPEAVPALRRLANPHLSRLQPGRRIFISRRGAPNPRLTNEADLAAMVEEEFGFELLDPSAMTFGEQVRAFSEAELIVAATGAALASLAFCSKGSRALVLMPRKLDLSFWQSIGAASGCEVTHMVGQLLPAPGPHKNLFTIEANQLRTGLHEALRTSGLAGAA